MDGAFELLLVTLHWRVLVSFISSIALAVMLSNTFESFTAGYCLFFVFLGVGLGIVWQDRVDIKSFKK